MMREDNVNFTTSREGESKLTIPQPLVQSNIPAPIVQMLDSLLNSPSIPLDFRKQFYVLWETVIFGNYSEKDIKYLMSKFREWCLLMLWYIPEQEWGGILDYKDTEIDAPFRVDYNLLFNTLEQLYFINLTRGKNGFTLKEINTSRSYMFNKPEDVEVKKEIRLF